MRVEEIMTKNVITVDMDATLETIRNIFARHNIHHVVIVDGNQIMGVISDRDILATLSPFIDSLIEEKRDISTLEKKAHQIMTRRPISIAFDQSIAVAAEIILENKISCLPVIDASSQLSGIITWRDLLRHLKTE